MRETSRKRGGTCNCHIIISDEPVASPIIQNPDILIAMNLPSLEKFENSVGNGGYIFSDSSLIDKEVARVDVKAVYIPATRLAVDLGLEGLANMVMVGKAVAEAGFLPFESVKEAMEKSVSGRKRDLVEQNIKALDVGYNLDV